MCAEVVLLPAPAIGRVLCLSHRGEQFSIKEFITELDVDGFSKAVLPRGAWLDVDGCGAAVFALTPKARAMNSRP